MPELPEVETYRRRIEDGALNRTILRVVPGNDTKHVDLPGPGDRARLEGHRFGQVRRHGKYLFAGVAGGPWLALHMGMAGSVRVYDQQDGQPDHARLVVEFEGDRRLAFRDPRKFGWAKVVESVEDEIAARGLGPDALEISDDAFAAAISGRRGAIKGALLHQGKLAGVGNLWSDEALFQTGHHPDTPARDLSGEAVRALGKTVRRILAAVCDVSADYGKLPDDWLIHHRKAGADCPRCDGTIEKTKSGGRTAFFCPAHQNDAA
ncbi:Fpg/Nei family DNA glycosylase [Oceaniglobus roseus]|uniref:Fpg/Nei family DNA glycosylase n=1 Tax=Oceaniglobus roseus TaxID=1737570 RepID=UPI000C7EDA61|nr:DNA-formamidopyrimidine glycosylase family protein [Kandeliimicrobium roseum]